MREVARTVSRSAAGSVAIGLVVAVAACAVDVLLVPALMAVASHLREWLHSPLAAFLSWFFMPLSSAIVLGLLCGLTAYVRSHRPVLTAATALVCYVAYHVAQTVLILRRWAEVPAVSYDGTTIALLAVAIFMPLAAGALGIWLAMRLRRRRADAG